MFNVKKLILPNLSMKKKEKKQNDGEKKIFLARNTPRVTRDLTVTSLKNFFCTRRLKFEAANATYVLTYLWKESEKSVSEFGLRVAFIKYVRIWFGSERSGFDSI